jgi:hypothetical protein
VEKNRYAISWNKFKDELFKDFRVTKKRIFYRAHHIATKREHG